MDAVQCVGRVRGLAMALGVGLGMGTALLAGSPAAWADGASRDTGTAGVSQDQSQRQDQSQQKPSQRGSDRPSQSLPAQAPNGHRPSPTASRLAVHPVAVQLPERAPRVSGMPVGESDGAGTAAAARPTGAAAATRPAAAGVAPGETPVLPIADAPREAPVEAPATDVVAYAAGSDLSGPPVGGSGDGTADSPLAWAALTVGRRQGSLFGNSITVNPDVSWSNGLLLGTLNAVSSRNLPLAYKVVDAPNLGGKIAWAPTAGGVKPDLFSYLPYMTTVSDPAQRETFSIMVTEVTKFDAFLKKIPVVKYFVDPVLGVLYRIPVVNTLLAPIIGSAQVASFDESAAALAAGKPVDFTYMMPSFDGTLISLNYFPAVNVASGDAVSAPTILNGPDLGFPGNTDVFTPWDPSLVNIVPGLNALRTDTSPLAGGYVGSAGGYNVITWDPRGEYASGGVMQLDNPNFEGRDVSSIISWATSAANVARDQVATDQTGDPFVGMVGGSYGGGIQLAVAGTPDKRIDAIVPSIAWHTLNQSLYPNNAFKTAIGTELLLALVATGARINNQIYVGIGTGALFGWLSSTSQALLTNSGPGVLTKNITAASLFLQGIPDILFELNASQINGYDITQANPTVPVKTTWFCGGHGVCLLPSSDQAEQGKVNMNDTLRWLDQYVAQAGTPADAIPTFQWFDQTGAYHSSDLNPFDPAFNNPTPLKYQGNGRTLLLMPLIGGTGPSKAAVPPEKPTTFSTAFSLAGGSKAWNAVNVSVTPPVGTEIAGAPTLKFDYSGLGTSKTVYAQLVDNATGLVLGNIVTPVPVTLDGRQHTAEIKMAPAVYEVYNSADSITLQITSSATAYANMTAWGFIKIGEVNLDVPTVG